MFVPSGFKSFDQTWNKFSNRVIYGTNADPSSAHPAIHGPRVSENGDCPQFTDYFHIKYSRNPVGSSQAFCCKNILVVVCLFSKGLSRAGKYHFVG